VITFDEAVTEISTFIQALPSKTMRFDLAYGHILAEDVESVEDIPLYDNSAMDGYALYAADVSDASEKNPVILDIVGEIFAGHLPCAGINRGETMKIMTGGALPEGADAVIMVERTEQRGKKAALFAPVRVGENIRRRGEDCKKGLLVLKKGTILGPAHVGMLATLGKFEVRAVPRPRVAILATGDELLEPWEPIEAGKVRNANSYSIEALVKSCGGVPHLLGLAKDLREEIGDKIKRGLESADMLITTAGISVGEGDLVREVLEQHGAVMMFWQVAIRPGKPTAFGKAGALPVFCLPGNPVSSMVTFLQFVRPAILAMRGLPFDSMRTVKAVLESDMEKKKGLRYFVRVSLSKDNEVYRALPTGPQGSGILSSMVKADGLMIFPEEYERVGAGEILDVQLLGDVLSEEGHY